MVHELGDIKFVATGMENEDWSQDSGECDENHNGPFERALVIMAFSDKMTLKQVNAYCLGREFGEALDAAGGFGREDDLQGFKGHEVSLVYMDTILRAFSFGIYPI